jgi:hypothetical protein
LVLVLNQNYLTKCNYLALINNNLRTKQLLHCLKLSDSKFLIVDGDDQNLEAIFDVRQEIENEGIRILVDHPDCQVFGEKTFNHYKPISAYPSTHHSYKIVRALFKKS